MTAPKLTLLSLKVLRHLLRCTQASGSDMLRALDVASGSLYPVLHRLEQAGWLSSKWEDIDPVKVGRPRRCYYSLTSERRAKAKAALEEVRV